MRLNAFFSKKYLYHFLLWAVVIVSLSVDAHRLLGRGTGIYLFFVAAKTLVMAALVYANLLFFYPALYKKKRYAQYTIWLVLITLAAGYTNMRLERFVRGGSVFAINRDHFMFFIIQLTMAMRYTLFSFLLKITVDFYEQKESMRRIEAEKARAELNFLKAQVNPHFLFNTLNSLYALILEKSSQSAGCVLKLAGMMQYILAEGSEDKVTLHREVELLRNYTELERLRRPDAGIRLTVTGDTERQQITPLLLLPLVENAFKYGLNTVSENGFVNIVMQAQEGSLKMTVENNIPAGNSPETVHGLGIGIENVRKRLELLYPKHHHLETEQWPDAYLVTLQLQLA